MIRRSTCLIEVVCRLDQSGWDSGCVGVVTVSLKRLGVVGLVACLLTKKQLYMKVGKNVFFGECTELAMLAAKEVFYIPLYWAVAALLHCCLAYQVSAE